ncbi:hydrogenase maturation nickel metallochaperone HypA [Christensenellaceae bacterium OttesenSCG-928-L17]|nr:hydrogenase maturation nickel metallochaperone HypA [Christensenellaceae bacterium OttesenSCG-928-L17]
MHELGIMYHVVSQVLSVVKENELEEVEAIVLQVGELASVVPRYLEACYPAAVDGTILENTALEIEMLPANALCRTCRKVYGVVEHKETCPHCGAKGGELLSGQEFYIKEIRAY